MVIQDSDWKMNGTNKNKSHLRIEKEGCSCQKAPEDTVPFTELEVQELTEDIGYAQIVNGILQMTPDIEDEIAAVERGETISMSKFKILFSKWL